MGWNGQLLDLWLCFDKGIVYGPFRIIKMASKLKEISWENPAPITTWSMMLFLAQG